MLYLLGLGPMAKTIGKNDYLKKNKQVHLECYWSEFCSLMLYYMYGILKIYKGSKHQISSKMSY